MQTLTFIAVLVYLLFAVLFYIDARPRPANAHFSNVKLALALLAWPYCIYRNRRYRRVVAEFKRESVVLNRMLADIANDETADEETRRHFRLLRVEFCRFRDEVLKG